MVLFDIEQLITEQSTGGHPFYEFLRAPSLSMGVYVLPEGGIDRQQPHQEDEVYFVISGRGNITVKNESRAVKAGSIIFVERDIPHHFHDIVEQLTLLVFFSPAET